MTLHDQAELAQFKGFQDRVLVAAVQAARDVAAEAPSGDPRKDELRATLATNLLASPESYAERFSWAVAANGSISFASSDSDIQWTVNSLWDAFAGV